MHVYKKRLKAGWNVGKGAKGDAEERQYAKEEIEQMVAEMDEDYRYRHVSKGTPNHRARLEHSIAWYEQVLARDKRSDSFSSYLRDGLVKAKARLAALE